MINIRPVSDLRYKFSEIEEDVNTGDPVYLTKNGYGKRVVMDVEYFEKIMNQAFEAKLINEGLFDMESGMVKDGEIVRDEMKKKYGF